MRRPRAASSAALWADSPHRRITPLADLSVTYLHRAARCHEPEVCHSNSRVLDFRLPLQQGIIQLNDFKARLFEFFTYQFRRQEVFFRLVFARLVSTWAIAIIRDYESATRLQGSMDVFHHCLVLLHLVIGIDDEHGIQASSF